MSIQKRHNNSHNAQDKRYFLLSKDKKITVKHLFKRLNFSINNNTIVIADVGDSLFRALYITIHGQSESLSPAYYLSMGFAVPAAIGAQLAILSILL